MGTGRASIAPAPILSTARPADADLSPKASAVSMRRVSINSAANESSGCGNSVSIKAPERCNAGTMERRNSGTKVHRTNSVEMLLPRIWGLDPSPSLDNLGQRSSNVELDAENGEGGTHLDSLGQRQVRRGRSSVLSGELGHKAAVNPLTQGFLSPQLEAGYRAFRRQHTASALQRGALIALLMHVVGHAILFDALGDLFHGRVAAHDGNGQRKRAELVLAAAGASLLLQLCTALAHFIAELAPWKIAEATLFETALILAPIPLLFSAPALVLCVLDAPLGAAFAFEPWEFDANLVMLTVLLLKVILRVSTVVNIIQCMMYYLRRSSQVSLNV